MKLVHLQGLIDAGPFTNSLAWRRVESDLRAAIDAVRWPPDGPSFTIYPESGKKRGRGNGVRPIKQGFILKLNDLGWRLEEPYAAEGVPRHLRPGAFDAWFDLGQYGELPFVVEWETGNISSSHRAMNKIGLALLSGRFSGGMLVLPTRPLYRFLTDRVGNYPELEPYFPLWSSLRVARGYLGVVAVEHDATSMYVPKIDKGTDGRALI